MALELTEEHELHRQENYRQARADREMYTEVVRLLEDRSLRLGLGEAIDAADRLHDILPRLEDFGIQSDLYEAYVETVDQVTGIRIGSVLRNQRPPSTTVRVGATAGRSRVGHAPSHSSSPRGG